MLENVIVGILMDKFVHTKKPVFTALAAVISAIFLEAAINEGRIYYQADYYIDYDESAAAGGDYYIREIIYFYEDSDYNEFIDSTTNYFWSLTLPIVD